MSSQPKQQPAQEQSSADRAIRSPAAVTIFLAVMGISLAADLFSKHAVFKSLLDDPALPQRIENIRAGYGQDIAPADILRSLRLQRRLCPGVRLSLSTNPGVVFGLPMPRRIVGITTLLAVVLVFYFFATSDRSARTVHVALALILAGAVGNLYDRLFGSVTLPGVAPIRYQVRDFIDCSGLYYPWVFNVADALLVVGVAMLAVYWWLTARSHLPNTKPAG